jgi:hypothetical protein
MKREWRLRTTVLPGHRIKCTVPDLPEGATVEIVVRRADGAPTRGGVLDFLDSLPAGPRSYPTWAEFERAFRQERDAWDARGEAS